MGYPCTSNALATPSQQLDERTSTVKRKIEHDNGSLKGVLGCGSSVGGWLGMSVGCEHAGSAYLCWLWRRQCLLWQRPRPSTQACPSLEPACRRDGEWHLAPLQLSGWLTFCSVHTMVQSCERTLVSGAKVVEGGRDYKSTIQVSPLIRAWKFSSVKTSAR